MGFWGCEQCTLKYSKFALHIRTTITYSSRIPPPPPLVENQGSGISRISSLGSLRVTMRLSTVVFAIWAAAANAAPTFPILNLKDNPMSALTSLSDYFNLVASKVQAAKFLSSAPACHLSQAHMPIGEFACLSSNYLVYNTSAAKYHIEPALTPVYRCSRSRWSTGTRRRNNGTPCCPWPRYTTLHVRSRQRQGHAKSCRRRGYAFQCNLYGSPIPGYPITYPCNGCALQSPRS